jgi:Mg/Co/Ni transporter MgtE
VSHFEGAIAQFAVLAVFMPIVTTATDVAGFLLFLGLGAAFLARFQ